MDLSLKTYQRNALTALADFFRGCRSGTPADAYRDSLTAQGNASKPEYVDVFGGAPTVCVRIPTGGGKTLLATYVIAEAGRCLLDSDAPVALWLTPSGIIQQQTLQALNTPGHPYRSALDRNFPQGVRICSLENLQTVARYEMGRCAVVIVATMQSFRVSDTTKRNVYAFYEELAPHFDGLPPSVQERLERVTESDLAEQPFLTSVDLGRVKHSVANWLSIHRPVIVVDEAHNARTQNTFETLKRLNPCAVVELTATPVKGSNVLYHVSAQELKAEEMIKLPVVLFEHPMGWQDAVHAAIQRRSELDIASQSETDYLRPIVLFQAEPKGGEATIEVLRHHLVEEEKIALEQIAVATGTQKELDGIDLFSPLCPIRFVLTVEALKEGWDCSFAYVLCTLQEIRSAKDVEQLLGRVLRMPYARRRNSPELNQAYAHVVASSVTAAVDILADRMVQNMGFEAYEAASAIVARQMEFAGALGPEDSRQAIFDLPFDVTLKSAPNLNLLAPEHRENVHVTNTSVGVNVTVSGEVAEEVLEALVLAAPRAEHDTIRRRAAVHNALVRTQSAPSTRGVKLPPVPQLCLRLDDEWVVVEPSLLAELGDWNLLSFPIHLDGFDLRTTAFGWEINVVNRALKISRLEESAQLDLDNVGTHVSESDLIYWLDRRVYQPDVSQSEMLGYLTKLIQHLQRDRQMPIDGLWRCRNQLADAIVGEIGRLRGLAQQKGFQQSLPKMSVVSSDTGFDYAWQFRPESYPRMEPVYSGRYKFKKHICGMVSELKSEGEEFNCARAIEEDSRVKSWLRNVPRSANAFCLPTSTDKFYPDFYAELRDGRLLVVEYKGEQYKTTDDSREKASIGAQWERTSGGRCLFLMAVLQDEKGRGVVKQISDKVAGPL